MLKSFRSVLLHSLVWGDTKPTRFFLALLDFAFAAYMWTHAAEDDMAQMIHAIPSSHPTALWSLLFLTHGTALLIGLRGRFNFFTLLLEGVLGIALWGIAALTNSIEQGLPGPTIVAFLMTAWILVRYPTHWGERDD